VFCTRKPATIPMVVGKLAAHTPSFFSVFSSIPEATTRGGAHWNSNIHYVDVICTILKSTYSKTSSLARNEELNVARNCIFTNSRFKPNLVNFIACCVDGHASFEIVHTAQNQIHWPLFQAAFSVNEKGSILLLDKRDKIQIKYYLIRFMKCWKLSIVVML
jgi:hypothetical protein